ncbi:hypothetical protein [Streptomyces sp. NPDC088725]|uniref:hypothetical protein n=1 Tax=Streptomyces sp. NPDC088725 TaxID=3365873 RepID=UPI0038195363
MPIPTHELIAASLDRDQLPGTELTATANLAASEDTDVDTRDAQLPHSNAYRQHGPSNLLVTEPPAGSWWARSMLYDERIPLMGALPPLSPDQRRVALEKAEAALRGQGHP